MRANDNPPTLPPLFRLPAAGTIDAVLTHLDQLHPPAIRRPEYFPYRAAADWFQQPTVLPGHTIPAWALTPINESRVLKFLVEQFGCENVIIFGSQNICDAVSSPS